MEKKRKLSSFMIGSILFYALVFSLSFLKITQHNYIKHSFSIILLVHLLLVYMLTYPSFKYIYHYYLVSGLISLFLFRELFLNPDKNTIVYLSVYYLIYLASMASKRIFYNYRDSITLHYIAPRLEPLIKKRFELEEKVHQVSENNRIFEDQKLARDWIYNKTKLINATLEYNKMIKLAEEILLGLKGINNFIFFIKENGVYKHLFEYNLNTSMRKYLKLFFENKSEKLFDKLSTYVKFEIEVKEGDEELVNLNIFPLILKGEVIGILMQFEDQECKNNNELIENIKIVTRYIAMGINKSYLYSRIQQLSRRDGLTLLYLRRIFDQNLHQEFIRCKRYKNKLSLIMMDIDFFKKLNDSCGHLFGDKVLTGIAEIIMENIKPPCTAFRYGGEEFVIICPDSDKKEAYHLAETIRRKVKDHDFKFKDKVVNTTISGGIAEFKTRMKSESELIKKADDNLYKAKKKGKNQIIL